MDARKATPGIDVRHRKTCPAPRADGRCCKPGYRAEVYDRRAQKRIRRTFPTLAAAKRWRQDALVDVRNGGLRVQRTATVREVAEAWLTDARRPPTPRRRARRLRALAIDSAVLAAAAARDVQARALARRVGREPDGRPAAAGDPWWTRPDRDARASGGADRRSRQRPRPRVVGHRSMPACAAASCSRCAGRTSTSRPARSTSRDRGTSTKATTSGRRAR